MDSEGNARGTEEGDELPDAVDVAVVGGGVVGCAVAGRLAQAGVRCVVLERDRPGYGATRAAAGMLSPLAEAEREGPFLRLGMRSLERYPEFVREVEDASGVDVEHRVAGKLQVALTAEEAGILERRSAFARKWSPGAEVVDSPALAEGEPCVTPAAERGLLLPDDHRLDSRRLGEAVYRWARRAGASVVTGTRLEEVLREGNEVRGVRLSGGRRLDARWVVVAAGSWSGRLGGLPRPLPVEPVRGQMVVLGPGPCRPRRAVESPRVYVVPRDDGRLLAGSTEERAGFERRSTAGGMGGILGAALELLPDLAEHPVVDSWAGLRPGTPDRLPILGPDPEVRGLLYATGHFRNGILLAPETARMLTAWIVEGKEGPPDEDFPPFRPHRFL